MRSIAWDQVHGEGRSIKDLDPWLTVGVSEYSEVHSDGSIIRLRQVQLVCIWNAATTADIELL